MNQVKTQVPPSSNISMLANSDSSHAKNTFLSSYDHNLHNSTTLPLPTTLNQQDHNALIIDLIQSFHSGDNINSFDVLLKYLYSSFTFLNNSTIAMESLPIFAILKVYIIFLKHLIKYLGKTLLMIAVEKGSLQLAQRLIEFRAQTELRDRSGKTALFYALETGAHSLALATLLLNSNADPNARTKGGVTPLLRAVEKGDFKLAELLVHRGSNAYAKLESSGNIISVTEVLM